MSHRDQKLVFTDSDMCSNNTINLGENNKNNEDTKCENKKTKRKQDEIICEDNHPRRSKRLAAKRQKTNDFFNNKKDNDIYESSESSEDTTDTDNTEDTDTMKEYSSKNKKHSGSRINKLISSILDPKPYTGNTEFDEAMDELIDESWFQQLSDKKQHYYIEKMIELQSFDKIIPTTKDIMNLDINSDSVKELILARRELDEYNKLSNVYNTACHKFLIRFEYLTNTDNFEKLSQTKKLEDNINNQIKFTQPLNERILISNFDDTTKSIIYDKYLIMCKSSEDTAAKYETWLETALAIPYCPKKIELDTSVPQNEAISKLITEMMVKLNDKVYGMTEAKEELVCMIANMIANPQTKNKAIGIYGPPGIGKTMIAKVVSDVLNLPIEQISLGGMTDSSFLEGHGFTYIGSEPGCIVKSIIKMKHTNGIIFLDELDKISKTERGKEIEYCLLHITDFTQNHDYRDKYLSEIPIDLSNYIFIYSMNTIEELDNALASRIPLIKFDGYTSKQKIDIVQNFILPELLANYGITKNDIIIPNDVISYMVQNINEENNINGKSGVRGLKKVLNRIINRINLYRVASINGKVNIDLSFTIPHFTIPYTLTTEFVKNIILGSCDRIIKSDYDHIYI